MAAMSRIFKVYADRVRLKSEVEFFEAIWICNSAWISMIFRDIGQSECIPPKDEVEGSNPFRSVF
tara:strand:+ start:4785 stop:4979 length:195 start_codon:yes stop_codon:yes gene_type:complete